MIEHILVATVHNKKQVSKSFKWINDLIIILSVQEIFYYLFILLQSWLLNVFFPHLLYWEYNNLKIHLHAFNLKGFIYNYFRFWAGCDCPFLTNCVSRCKEEKEAVLSRALLGGKKKIMPSHQFYLGLAVAPAVCFQESWHFYLPACSGGGTDWIVSHHGLR